MTEAEAIARIVATSEDRLAEADGFTAYELFRELRWHATDGDAVCPWCGHDDPGFLDSRGVFKCTLCRRQFSETTGTVFSGHKIDFYGIVSAIKIIVEGGSYMDIARQLSLQYRSAWGIGRKIRKRYGKYCA